MLLKSKHHPYPKALVTERDISREPGEGSFSFARNIATRLKDCLLG
jgi:hypothetical protein